MKRICLTLVSLSLAFFAQSAHASLLAESCDVDNQTQNFLLETQTWGALPMGLTCGEIRTIEEYKEVVGLAISPYLSILATPVFKQKLASEIASLGLTPATAAVLTVTIVGTVGIRVVNILLKNALDECERMDQDALKNSLLNELNRKFGTSSSPNLNLEMPQ